MKNQYKTFYKVIKSGDMVEYMEYNLPENKKSCLNNDKVEYDKLEYRKKYLLQVKKRISRLIRCNPDMCRFWSLTYKNTPLSYDIALNDYKTFIKRLNYYLKDSNIKYVAILEYGSQNNRLHFHFLTDRFINNKVLAKIWGKGFVDVKYMYNLENAVDYLTKYLTKISPADSRYFNRKVYLSSKNLDRPIIFKSSNIWLIKARIDSWEVENKLKKKLVEIKRVLIETDFLGTIDYRIYQFVCSINC